MRNPAVVYAAETIAERVLDHPSECSHRAAVFVCARHPQFGAACMPCMDAHQKTHTPLDEVCNSCDVLRPVTTGLLPAGGDFVLVVRLCTDCAGANDG